MEIKFNLSSNFWESNLQFKLLEECQELINLDKSKSKNYSSQVMWAIILLLHPESLYYNLSEKDKVSTIKREYLKDPNFEFSKYNNIISRVKDLILTPAKRQLFQWNKLMSERSEFMEVTKYSAETQEMLDKMMSNTPKLYEQLQKISDMLEREGDEGITKGGGEQSASEKGLI